MIRALLAIVGIFSTVALLAEFAVVGWLWTQGTLTPSTLQEVRLALSGQPSAEPELEPENAQTSQPSQSEIHEARVIRILDLESRENELSLLKRLTSESANQLISDRRSFDELKAQFRSELEGLRQQTEDAATEQTRAILLATPPEDAVKRLMGLTTAEGVGLLRGLPEKSIAKILLAFQTDLQTAPRGQELFEALYHGEPTRSVIENSLNRLEPATAEPTRPAG